MYAKWEDQLELCLKTARALSEPWENDVHDAIFLDRKSSFQKHEDHFEDVKAEVLRGSELVGKIARVCADHDSRREVSINDMMAGVAAAKLVCKARAKATHGGPFHFLWCE